MMPYNGAYNMGYQTPPQPRHLDFVAGEQGVDAFYVGPGESVALFDKTEMRMWVKSADMNGVTSKTPPFRLVEEEPPKQPEYVTKQDFEDFKNEVLEAVTGGK